MAVKGGGRKFLLEMGESQEWGGWFYNGEGGKFYEGPPIMPTLPLLFKFCPTLPLSCHLQPPLPLFFLLSCFFCWMGDHGTFDMLFYLRIIWIYTSAHVEPWYLSTRRTFMCVSCIKASSLLRPNTWWSFLLVLWFDITQAHTAHWHTHKYIFTPPVMCS